VELIVDGTSARSSRGSVCPILTFELRISVGDITPVEGVPAHVKHQLEEEAMDAFLNEMLGAEGNKEAKERFRSLWDVSPCIWAEC
jgi:hypothetical protein